MEARNTVVITGAHGFIANSLRRWLEAKDQKVCLLDLKDPAWEAFDFTRAHTVIHTAALVHKSEKEHPIEEYRAVNRDLTVKLAEKAKAQGVRHFIFFSTMAVYGSRSSCFSACAVDENTPTAPDTKYGITKLEAEEALQAMEDEHFRLAIIRPPFVYGKDCPGNYRTLRTLTLKIGLIPKLSNQKSMIYIDNLCACVEGIRENGLTGVFCPQNARIVSTWVLAEEIALCNGKKPHVLAVLNPFVKLGSLAVRKLRTAFGTEYYTPSLSTVEGLDYNVVSFEESVRRTEG